MNKLQKILSTITFVSIINLSGCISNEPEVYKIKGDKVRFLRGAQSDELRIIKPDGRNIVYTDMGHDSTVDIVTIYKHTGWGTYPTQSYSKSETVAKHIFEEAQKQFDNYMEIIGKDIQQKAINNLK